MPTHMPTHMLQVKAVEELDHLLQLCKDKETVRVSVSGFNRGGLLVTYATSTGKHPGFIPNSQLGPVSVVPACT